MDWIDLLQWPAMVVTVLASWLVASKSERHRNTGFWIFMLSNLLWIAWGWSTQAYALITLQIALAVMNMRGAKKTDAAADDAQAKDSSNGADHDADTTTGHSRTKNTQEPA